MKRKSSIKLWGRRRPHAFKLWGRRPHSLQVVGAACPHCPHGSRVYQATFEELPPKR